MYLLDFIIKFLVKWEIDNYVFLGLVYPDFVCKTFLNNRKTCLVWIYGGQPF